MPQNGLSKLYVTKTSKTYLAKNQLNYFKSERMSEAIDKVSNVISKKHNITPQTITEEKQDMCLSSVPVSNSFSLLQDQNDIPTNNAVVNDNPSDKPPPVYIKAYVIMPLVELLKELAEESFTMKQLSDYLVKVQVNTFEIYRNFITALKEKNANFHTHQFKKDRSYKVILRGMHPCTDLDIIVNELKKFNHQVRHINNITSSVTKESLPLFFIELEPSENNKEVYKINRLYNMIVSFEPPKVKRDIPQCLRCQSFGHTKNYCNRIPACVKCAGEHWTSNCLHIGKINDVKCSNCQGNHPASYKGCLVRKQLLQKLFPKLRQKSDIKKLNPLNETTFINHGNNTTNDVQHDTRTSNKTFAEIVKTQVKNDTFTSSENISSETTLMEIKNLLIASTKNSELVNNMLIQQTQLLTQQSQQTNKMIELLSTMLNNNLK